MMSMDPVPVCPVCGGDRTSMAIDGELYCVECNRLYAIVESHMSAFASREADGDEDSQVVIQVKRAA
jgi:18S rRNA m6A1832 methyltransferase subunit Trm112p-like protein